MPRRPPCCWGYAGWWPPDIEFPPEDGIVSTHGTDRNPRLCAGCHVFPFTVTDELTGEFVFQATGHLFDPIPCLDERGVPQGGSDCDDDERTYQSCTTAGCHSSAEGAQRAMERANAVVQGLADELEALLDKVPDDALDPDDGVYTVAEGATFNLDLAQRFPGSATHNRILMDALLRASIVAVEEEYGVSLPTPTSAGHSAGS